MNLSFLLTVTGVVRKLKIALLLAAIPAYGAVQDKATFDLSHLDAPRRGTIGFLHGITPNILPTEWVTDLKPTIWRGYVSTKSRWKPGPGIPGLDGYKYLKDTIHVLRYLMDVTPSLRSEPYKTILQKEGREAAVAALAQDAKTGGDLFEWDVINEPKLDDMNSFMDEIWNPTVRGLHLADPQAKIHGPSLSFVSSVNENCHGKLFDFLTRAHASGTLPNYVNWHCQDGYDIAQAQGALAEEIRVFYREHNSKLDGVVCGETIRPGNERNTSPSVAIDVFAAAEIYDIVQIHACWGSVKVYGQDLNRIPTLCGLLNNDWSGRRGVWWTYRFYAQTEGRRISCVEGPSGSRSLVVLAFADGNHSKIRAMVGLRDGVKKQTTGIIRFDHLSQIPGLSKNGVVKVAIWDNPQTEDATDLTSPAQIYNLTVTNDSINLLRDLKPWGGILIEITPSAK